MIIRSNRIVLKIRATLRMVINVKKIIWLTLRGFKERHERNSEISNIREAWAIGELKIRTKGIAVEYIANGRRYGGVIMISINISYLERMWHARYRELHFVSSRLLCFVYIFTGTAMITIIVRNLDLHVAVTSWSWSWCHKSWDFS